MIEEERNIIELPIMKLHIRKASSDFITEEIDIACSGSNIDECKRGIAYLIYEAKRMND
jgi:hypothetical protein